MAWSQPAFTHWPWTHTDVVSGPQVVPSVTCRGDKKLNSLQRSLGDTPAYFGIHCMMFRLRSRSGTGPAAPRSTALRSAARGRCTPGRRTPPLLHTSGSSSATGPTSSNRRPQTPAVTRGRSALAAKGNLRRAARAHRLASGLRPHTALAC
ncbi:hypothetical protein EYF80_035905 [Liparis tanakae]|uniref:Uncharacterized protein n=1 Tax=Liparis tanakae TaxID=230148 RepID=A0A4Z2GM14_9TELE|nr:hypothetical protein EYF80_035905 [Liparis tanakae]